MKLLYHCHCKVAETVPVRPIRWYQAPTILAALSTRLGLKVTLFSLFPLSLKSVDSFSCPLRHVAQAQWIPHPRKPSLCHTSNWPVLDQLTEQPCRLSPQTCADKQSTSHILILDEASGQNSLWQGLVQSRLLTSNRIISCISRFQLLWYILHKIIYLGTLLECHHCSKKPTMMYTIRDMKGNCLLTKCYGVWIYHGQTSPSCVGHRIRDNKWTIILPGYLLLLLCLRMHHVRAPCDKHWTSSCPISVGKPSDLITICTFVLRTSDLTQQTTNIKVFPAIRHYE